MTDHEWGEDWSDGSDFLDSAGATEGFGAAPAPDDPSFDPSEAADFPDLPDVPDLHDLPQEAYLADVSEVSDLADPEVDGGDGMAGVDGVAGVDGGNVPVGADPDAVGEVPDPVFPPALALDPPPEPVDGYPWADAANLGAAPQADPAHAYQDAPEAAEVARYAAAEPGTQWATLVDSDDPATSALARWWSSPTPDSS
ncbi:hypothetical protein WEI85_13745 [Actinomycetes bacterium KLBMP 9797]